MKTIVIHPFDPSTDFLEPVYSGISDTTLVRGGLVREELEALVSDHDRVMMMGHGSSAGLLSVGRFPGSGMYIVDYRLVHALKKKRNCVFIWCNADSFVEYYKLDGFYSGMFISEVTEALAMGMRGITQDQVKESNELFSCTAGKFINSTEPAMVCENIRREYGLLGPFNPVARFNIERLYHS